MPRSGAVTCRQLGKVRGHTNMAATELESLETQKTAPPSAELLDCPFSLLEVGCAGKVHVCPRGDTAKHPLPPLTTLPHGLPPVLQDLQAQLRGYLQRPEDLPIHDFQKAQKSLANKLEEYQCIMLDNNVDVGVVSETWFSPDMAESCLSIDGYTLFSKCRCTRLSDHCMVMWEPKAEKRESSTATKTVRPIRDSGRRAFGQWVFTGNTDGTAPSIQPFPADVTCRYLRFFPAEWSEGGIAFRINILISRAAAASFTLLQHGGSVTMQHGATSIQQQSLTMVGNLIPDASFSASSELDAGHAAVYGNLGKVVEDGTVHFWAPSTDQAGEFVEVDLTQPLKISGVATKGGGTRWLTKFKIQHSMDGSTWTDYEQEVTGNTDGDGQNLQPFATAFTCQYIRIVTVAGGWSAGGAGLRFSPLLEPGVAQTYMTAMQAYMQAHMQSHVQSQSLTMVGNLIPDASFSASSELDAGHAAVYGNLGKVVEDGTVHFWAPSTDQAGEFLEVDLTQPLKISGVATKGGGTRWLTKFKIQHSMDGSTWTDYEQEITGNTDGDGQNLQPFATAFTCQYIRIVTVAGGWSAGGAGLRFSPLLEPAVAQTYLTAMQAYMQAHAQTSMQSSSQQLDCSKWSEWLDGLMNGPQAAMIPQVAQGCKPVWCRDPAFAEAKASLHAETCADFDAGAAGGAAGGSMSMTHTSGGAAGGSTSMSTEQLDCSKWSEWLDGLMNGPHAAMVPQLAESCKPVWCRDPAFAEAKAGLHAETCAGFDAGAAMSSSSMTHSSSASVSQQLDCAKWAEWLPGLMAAAPTQVDAIGQSCKPVWCADAAFMEANAELAGSVCAAKKREEIQKLRSLLDKIKEKKEMKNSPQVHSNTDEDKKLEAIQELRSLVETLKAKKEEKEKAKTRAVPEPVQKRLEKAHNLVDLLETLIA
ncbi:PREDICTED: uncharacterized protein LOC109461971 [Branchiostoma belcheri]|uniref:Uncharacterized protein LOC109461971 n=1 Tax=Branchiostoma belcheri TaxID=7741 RepID=A0A6P4XBY3_BRABE|nr:PREDICTED: uncharacterized protein LOC109461971 [Branchiostoma belcheri]